MILALVMLWVADWTAPTDSFKPVVGYQIAISENGDLFYLNRENHCIDVWSQSGQKRLRFGSKGEGPGSFIRPHYLYIHNSLLYLRHDGVKCSVFDLDGHFVNQTKDADFFKPGFYLNSQRTILNWTHLDPKPFEWLFLERQGNEWLDRSVLNDTWRVESPTVSGRYRFDPTYQSPMIVFHPHGNKVILVGIGDQARIWQMDMLTGAVEPVICPEFSKIPFNEEWGEAQLKLFKQGSAGIDVTYTPPEIFPAIKQAWFAPGDHVIVELWTGFPDKDRKFAVINLNGKPVGLNFDPALITRVSGWTEDEVVFCSIDEDNGDDPAMIIRTTWDRFDALSLQYPFIYDDTAKHFVRF